MKKTILSLVTLSLILTLTPLTAAAQSEEERRETAIEQDRRENYTEYKETKERREEYRRLEYAQETETELETREKLLRRVELYEDKLTKFRAALTHFQTAAETSEGRTQHLYNLRVKIIEHLIEKLETKLAEMKTHLESTQQ